MSGYEADYLRQLDAKDARIADLEEEVVRVRDAADAKDSRIAELEEMRMAQINCRHTERDKLEARIAEREAEKAAIPQNGPEYARGYEECWRQFNNHMEKILRDRIPEIVQTAMRLVEPRAFQAERDGWKLDPIVAKALDQAIIAFRNRDQTDHEVIVLAMCKVALASLPDRAAARIAELESEEKKP